MEHELSPEEEVNFVLGALPLLEFVVEMMDIRLDVLFAPREKDDLESVIKRAYSGYINTLEKRIAHIVYSIIKNHTFVDGNKRGSFCVAIWLLTIHGYQEALFSAELRDKLESAIFNIADSTLNTDEDVLKENIAGIIRDAIGSKPEDEE